MLVDAVCKVFRLAKKADVTPHLSTNVKLIVAQVTSLFDFYFLLMKMIALY